MTAAAATAGQLAAERVRRARSLVGRPWRSCDCLAVAVHAFRWQTDADDLALARLAGYPACARRPAEAGSCALVAFLTKRLVICEHRPILPGDLLLLAAKSPDLPDHVAVAADRDEIVHATRRAGVIAEPRRRLAGGARLVAVMRPAGVVMRPGISA